MMYWTKKHLVPAIFLLAAVCVALFVLWRRKWSTPTLEQFLEPKAYDVIILAHTAKKAVVDKIELQPSTVVINQSDHKLNALYEFEVNNDTISVEDMETMAREILPTTALIKFVVIK